MNVNAAIAASSKNLGHLSKNTPEVNGLILHTYYFESRWARWSSQGYEAETKFKFILILIAIIYILLSNCFSYLISFYFI